VRALAAVVVAAAALIVASACQDPCVTLAERICNCEATSGDRATCRTERIVNQQSSTKIEDADRAVCEKKLDTCTCAALDVNDLDACGFVPEGQQ
jgi:hypothetical protein